MRNYEEIMEGVLARIPDSYDKREGSVIWNAIAPLCYELAEFEFRYENDMAETFLGTANGQMLDSHAEDYGYIREQATPCEALAELVSEDVVPIGTRFSAVDEDIYYKVSEYLGGNEYSMIQDYVLDEDGNEYLSQSANYYTGELLPLDNINNLESATLTEVTIPQKQTESDDEFRERIKSGIKADKENGNQAQYESWLSEIDGVGNFKVIPLWNGANTVKCLILNELQTPASSTLVQKVQGIIDPNASGLGNGLAPIGARVTVATPTAKTINITAKVVFKNGVDNTPYLEDEIREFFREIALKKSVVSLYQLGAVFYADEDIDSVVTLTMNGSASDVSIGANEVAVLGVLNVSQ